jgi:hypothetical protein
MTTTTRIHSSERVPMDSLRKTALVAGIFPRALGFCPHARSAAPT